VSEHKNVSHRSTIAVLVLAAASGMAEAQASPPAPAGIERIACAIDTVEGPRRYHLDHQRGGDGPARWVLTLLDTGGAGRAAHDVAIVLKGAKPPVRKGDSVTFEYRSPHGGYIVELEAGPRGFLDVFVSHGLEVNVEPDLSPDVDRLNTDGKRDARCQVIPAAQP
jgi:hypothetical protein